MAAVSLGLIVPAPGLAWVPRKNVNEIPTLPPPPSDTIDLYSIDQGVGALVDAYDTPEADPRLLAQSLGTDVDAAFRYVRDEIRTEPYRGTLRTPRGVLSGKAGNPQDKAELLMGLFETMGFDARIASGPALSAEAIGVGTQLCDARPFSDPHAPAILGLSDSALDRLVARASHDYDKLNRALGVARTPRTAAAPSTGDTHYWVQRRSADGWVDYDPSIPTAEPGERYADATDVGRGGDEAHSVEISLRTEVLRNGRLIESQLLSRKADARDIAGKQILLVFEPVATQVGGAITDAIGRIADTPMKMRPVLLIDDQRTSGAAFEVPRRSGEEAFFASDESGPQLSAVWLDVVSLTPNPTKDTARRAVLDRNPMRSTDAATFEPIEAGFQFPAAFEAVRHLVVSNGGLSPAAAAANAMSVFEDFDEAINSFREEEFDPFYLLWLGWSDLYAAAMLSERITRQTNLGADTGCPFVGRPRVFMETVRMNISNDVTETFDWTLDHVDAIGPSPFAVRLWHGAVQSALETTLDEVALVDGETVLSTSTQLTGPLKILDKENSNLGRVIASDAQNGYLVLADDEGSATRSGAWWRIHPTTGDTDARFISGAVGNMSRSIREANARAGIRRPSGNGSFRAVMEEWDKLQEERARRARGRAMQEGVRRPSAVNRAGRREFIRRERLRQGLNPRGYRAGGTEYQILLGAIAVVSIVAFSTLAAVMYDRKLQRAQYCFQNPNICGGGPSP